jgi:hypothetical protein
MRTANIWMQDALKAGDDWKHRRAIARSGTSELTQQMLEDFIVMSQAIKKGIYEEPNLDAFDKAKLLGSISDSCSKMASAISRMNPKITKLDVANQVLGFLEEYVRTEQVDCLECFEKILLPFSSFLVKKLK